MPKLGKSKRNNKVLYHLQVRTRNYPFLKEIFDAFYIKNSLNTFIKVIPKKIYYWLNPISLAYWAMDEGGSTSSGTGFYLHTKGFNFMDVYFLAGVMHYKFNIICTVQNHENRPMLYITSKSKNKYVEIVYPYFHESLLYKLK